MAANLTARPPLVEAMPVPICPNEIGMQVILAWGLDEDDQTWTAQILPAAVVFLLAALDLCVRAPPLSPVREHHEVQHDISAILPSLVWRTLNWCTCAAWVVMEVSSANQGAPPDGTTRSCPTLRIHGFYPHHNSISGDSSLARCLLTHRVAPTFPQLWGGAIDLPQTVFNMHCAGDCQVGGLLQMGDCTRGGPPHVADLGPHARATLWGTPADLGHATESMQEYASVDDLRALLRPIAVAAPIFLAVNGVLTLWAWQYYSVRQRGPFPSPMLALFWPENNPSPLRGIVRRDL